MRFQRASWQVPFVSAAAVVLAACGGGGGGGGDGGPGPSSSPPPKNLSPGGIWKGTASSGQSILGIVTEDGAFTFIQDDGVQYFCNMSVTNNSVSAGFTGIATFGTRFANGASTGGGSLSATLVERSSMTGSISFSTSGVGEPQAEKAEPQSGIESVKPCGSTAMSLATGKTDPTHGAAPAMASDHKMALAAGAAPGMANGTITLTYDRLYERGSSLAMLAGNFKTSNGTVFTVDANGRIFSQDASSGCVANGQASVIDTKYNEYSIEYTLSSCTGDASVLNGANFSGHGTLDNSAVPERAIVAVRHQSNSNAFGLVGVLDRT